MILFLDHLRRYVMLGLLIGLIFGGVYMWYVTASPDAASTSSPPVSAETLDPERVARESAHWQRRIEVVGAEAAHEEFASRYEALADLGLQHSFAHIFGDALYQSAGIAGIAVCDERFGFGCYHSFFGRAIAENGIDIIGELDRACISVHGERGLGCPHGIGHGVLAYLGPDHLSDALASCATLSWQQPIGGCTSGAFMEFNFRTMDGPNVGHRPLHEGESLHYPCTEVDPSFRQACYFEQVQWWFSLFRSESDPHTFASAHVGALCAEVGDQDARYACYRGVGNFLAGRFAYDAPPTVQECAHMPDTTGRAYCQQGAAWITSAQPAYEERWIDMCVGLEGAHAALCLSAKDFI